MTVFCLILILLVSHDACKVSAYLLFKLFIHVYSTRRSIKKQRIFISQLVFLSIHEGLLPP